MHTPRGLSHSLPSDDSQVDALEHSVDVAAVQNSLAHMSMPQAAVKNARRPQANSPGLGMCCSVTINVEAFCCVVLLPAGVSWFLKVAVAFELMFALRMRLAAQTVFTKRQWCM